MRQILADYARIMARPSEARNAGLSWMKNWSPSTIAAPM